MGTSKAASESLSFLSAEKFFVAFVTKDASLSAFLSAVRLIPQYYVHQEQETVKS